jgi:tRNA(Ile)-lysidine synthase
VAKQHTLEPGFPPALIAAAVSRHAMIGQGARLGVAVSGGADSVCLLVALAGLARQFEWDLTALHLNHGLRGDDADSDAAFVAGLADRLGLGCHIQTIVIESGPDWENRARRARLEFFSDQMKALPLDRVATGHTLDDQAETVLLRLLRGAAPESLCGILPVTQDGLIRPMLDVTHDAAREWLTRQGIAWREDASNQQTHYTRNWLRREILPAIETRFPAARATLARHASVALDDREFFGGATAGAVMRIFEPRPDAFVAKVQSLAELPASLRGRVVRYGLARWTRTMVDTSHVEAVVDLAMGGRHSGRVRLAEVEAWLSMGMMRIGRPLAMPAVQPVEVSKEGIYPILWRGTRLHVDALGPRPATLRAWLPGDRAGWTSPSKRMKDIFQSARIPVWERASWPVLEAGGLIVWAGKLGAAGGVAAEEQA